MCHTGRNDYHIARMHLDVLAMLAAESQSGSARINTEHFMRRAVIMRKGIDSVSPRVGPIVFGKTLFENGRRIFGIGCDCLPIKQQRKGTIWENTAVFEIQLLGLNKIVLLSHAQFSRVKVILLYFGRRDSPCPRDVGNELLDAFGSCWTGED